MIALLLHLAQAAPVTGPMPRSRRRSWCSSRSCPSCRCARRASSGCCTRRSPRRSTRSVHLGIALAGLVAAGVTASNLWSWTGAPSVLGDVVAADRFSVRGHDRARARSPRSAALRLALLGRAEASRRGEFFPLLLFATAGMTLIVAAADLIVVFLALEILSLSLYVLTGIARAAQLARRR